MGGICSPEDGIFLASSWVRVFVFVHPLELVKEAVIARALSKTRRRIGFVGAVFFIIIFYEKFICITYIDSPAGYKFLAESRMGWC